MGESLLHTGLWWSVCAGCGVQPGAVPRGLGVGGGLGRNAVNKEWLFAPSSRRCCSHGAQSQPVLVDGEGHLVVEVVDEAELAVLDGTHGVVHGGLVVALAAEGGGPGLL